MSGVAVTKPSPAISLERHRVSVGDVTIAYQTAGAGPPLILVHGLSGSTRWWSRNVDAFARRFQVHIVDLVGFGGSRSGGRFVLADAAGILAAWLERIGISEAMFAGHSLGGLIVADLAACFPWLVRRLVLVDAAILPLEGGYPRHTLRLLRALRRLPVSFWPVLVTDAWRAGPGTIARAARELLTTESRPDLAALTVPTLVVWGQHDSLMPPEQGRQLARSIPNARLVVIPGAGHNPMWDRPAEFNRAALAFFADPPPPVA